MRRSGDKEIPLGAEFHGQRWQIETNLRHLKQTLRMDVLRCQTVEGVQKELTILALVYNLVRLVMLKAAQRQEVPVERLSFVAAVPWLAGAVSGDAPLMIRVNPHRPNRVEPRVVKRRPKDYSRFVQPRAPPQTLTRQQTCGLPLCHSGRG